MNSTADGIAQMSLLKTASTSIYIALITCPIGFLMGCGVGFLLQRGPGGIV